MADHIPDWLADCHASGTVRTAAYAVREDDVLNLCGHCLHTRRPTLTVQGWDIVPAPVSPGTGTGTEATGVHYAVRMAILGKA